MQQNAKKKREETPPAAGNETAKKKTEQIKIKNHKTPCTRSPIRPPSPTKQYKAS